MLAVTILAAAACGGANPANSQPPDTAPSPTAGTSTCPEAIAGFVPSGMTLAERSYPESGGGATAIRVQYLGAGGRELTLLTGVAGEIGFGDTGVRRTIRGHEASIRSAPGGTFIAWWLEGPEGSPCSQYAVITAGLTAEEFEEILRSIQ